MTTYTETDLNSQNPALTISDPSRIYLRETAKWGNFLAIAGFIGSGLLVLFGLIFSFSFSALQHLPMDTMPGMLSGGFSFLFGFIYILIAILYFFPSLYLYRFSNKLKMALSMNNEEELTEAFSNHKSLFKFMGILTIVTLSLYALMFLFGILGAVVAGF